jgi:RNA polymerase subunit RPABC4/transcription elongation factor Spt4
MLAVLLFITLSIIAVAATSVTGEDTGTLMGDITIVGQENLRDGEVVVSFAGTDDEAGNTGFDSADPHYSIDLAPGDYTAYAWAPVFHNSDRVAFTIVANETTWVNLTVVRQEEVLGTVSTPKGAPVEDAIVQFLMDGTLVAATETDDEGKFRDSLDPGNYEVNITKVDFKFLLEEFTIEPGEVVNLTLVMEPKPIEEAGEEFPVATVIVLLFIVIAAGLSIGLVVRQTRRLRMAQMKAEADRSRDLACPECGGVVPEGERKCPECDHVLQVRCEECGRSMDMGTAACPECGTVMD